MSFIHSLMADFSNAVNNNDPQYVQLKKDINQIGENINFIGKAAVVATIALAILGLALIATPVFPLGIVFIALSGLSFCCVYNAFELSINVKQVANNPMLYVDHLRGKLKTAELKDQLETRTFGVRWLINDAVDKIDRGIRGH